MGKYFCQCCHSNDTEVIPGRVIMRWDFSRYYVSNFARDLLSKIHHQPLFHVDAINPMLYKKFRTLDSVRDLRRQFGHLSTLLNICKRNTKWVKVYILYIYREREREREWILVDNGKASKYVFSVLLVLWLPNSLWWYLCHHKTGLLCSRLWSHQGFRSSVPIWQYNIFWTTESFVTKINMMMHLHEAEYQAIRLISF